MTYESWRITFQDSEQAARAAYTQIAHLTAERDQANKWAGELHQRLAEREEQLTAASDEIEQLKKVGEEDSYRYGFAVAENHRLRELVELFKSQRMVDGFNGRTWRALRYYAIEEKIQQALAQTERKEE